MNTTQPARQLALINGRVILPSVIVTGRALVIQEGKIGGLVDVDDLDSETERINVDGRLISPGLIDIHTHGAQGHTFNEPTAQAFSTITGENASRGVTSLLATPATAPLPDLLACLQFSREWMQSEHGGAQVLGVHLEGPYFSLSQAGAQDPANIRNPDDDSVDQLLAYHDVMQIMSYAPELPGALALTARLKQLGIVAAAGHSSATEDDVIAAKQVGLQHIIHIWSAQSTIVREGPWRKPGLLETSLSDDDFTVEMICDNKHLPPSLMKLAYKCLGPDRLCAISDATSGAGLAEGAHFRMGDMEYEVHGGVGMMFDRSCFAGSTTLLNNMIPILVEQVGIPLPKAIRMASLTPARVCGVDKRKGSIETGKDADIAIFNSDFSAWRTLIAGRWV
ncbi:MAG: N-acetylglucosamine-6-phosphate deacetylase [Chloroflexi bacterium]|nr:N-acetylglucosamine-6-phosphate deacetylase [Chloroflexota bacterium]